MKKMAITATILILAFIGSGHAGTTITWWQFWTDPGVKPTIEAIADDFEKANPDISVELTDLTWTNGHEKIVMAFSAGM